MVFANVSLTPSTTRSEVFDLVRDQLKGLDLEVIEEDLTRPWGGFFRISPKSVTKFIETFYPKEHFNSTNNLGPKILIFEPNKRISWQVHQRRGEYWKVLFGPVGIYLNDNDKLPEHYKTCLEGEIAYMTPGTRHRNAALNNWGLVAEIWEHTDPSNLSDEADNRRILDDFNRD